MPQTRTHGWKTSKVYFILQILIKVVSAFQSGVFSCLLAWVVAIIKKGFGGYIPDAKAYPFRLVDDPTKMDVHKALHPFYTTKKTPKITATVANRVCPLNQFYTEQIFVLVCMDILRLSCRVLNELQALGVIENKYRVFKLF